MPSFSHDGKWIYFRSDRTGAYQIWRVPLAGGAAEQITRHGGFSAYESTDGKTLFHTNATSSPLFATPLDGGAEHQLLPWVEQKAFIPVDDGIYYIGRRNDKEQYPLQFYRFSSEKSEMLTPIDGLLYQGRKGDGECQKYPDGGDSPVEGGEPSEKLGHRAFKPLEQENRKSGIHRTFRMIVLTGTGEAQRSDNGAMNLLSR